jgi:hypothetical protein
VVTIGHILSAIYSNEPSGGTFGEMEGYFSKFTIFTGATPSTKDVNMVVFGK